MVGSPRGETAEVCERMVRGERKLRSVSGGWALRGERQLRSVRGWWALRGERQQGSVGG
ncbi:hypothetical protein NDU88_000762, partial [Pleurodeles waltl]